jgi:hypothetical protein
MTNSTLSPDNIKVHGNYRGFYSAAYSVSGNTVTINPDSSFKPGEVITVSVTTGVQNSTNEPMASPRVYSFTVDAPGGYNKFSSPVSYTAYGSGSGNHYSVMADLDKDGDIDIATTTSLYNSMSVLLNNGNGTYASAVTYTTLNAFDICAADVDGDGDMDLVVANNSAFGMSVFINNGAGAFGTRNDFAFTFPQSNAQFVVPVDIDGDGDIDVVTNDLTYNYLHIMKNNGSGSFTSTDKQFTTKFGALSAGDLDKDGDMDILAACATVDSVEQMNNDGAGNLSMATRFYWTSTNAPSATLIADINSTFGDKQDLVWLNSGSDLLSYFMDGSGIPLFTADNVSVGDYPSQVNAVDVDTDNDLDLVVANYNDATFSVLTNTGSGTGTFTRTNYAIPTYPDDLTTGDIDGDGDMDIVTVNNNAVVTVFKNYNGGHVASITPANGTLDASASSNIVVIFDENINSGTLTANTVKLVGSVSGVHAWTLSSYVAGTYTATLNPTVDFTPGEVVTVVVTNGVQSSVGIGLEKGYSSQFVVAAGNGAVFGANADYAAGDQSQAVIMADVNADGFADIVTANTLANNIAVLLNNGNGTYASAVTYAAGNGPTSVAAGDVNGDGRVDLVATSTTDNQLSVFINNNNTGFNSRTAVSITYGSSPQDIRLADVDGDGDLDAIYNISGYVYYMTNNGSGAFSSGDNGANNASPSGLAVVDVDNDGDLDFLSVNNSSNTVVLSRFNGTVWYSSTASYGTGVSPTSIATGDFNGDGYIDVVTGNLASGNGTISYLQNNQSSGLSTKVDYSLPAGAQPRGVAAVDIDGDGDLDVVVANGSADAASVFINNGSGTFSDGGQFTTGDNPYAVASADANGDGVMDIVTANYAGDNVSVLMNIVSAPIVTTSAASGITTTGATLNGIVNAMNLGTVTRFAYKLNSAGSYAATDTVTASPTGFAGGANTTISAAVTGLQQNTMYNFKAIGVNSAGTTEGSALNFTTLEDALTISSITPAKNGLDVDTAANITVTFNVDANADSLNARNVLVKGSMSGSIAGTISYDGPTKTMTFNPTGYFRAGEIVSVTLKSGIASASALSFLTARTYSFSAAATGAGPGFFDVTTVSNFFSNSESEFMSADVNKDGFVDLIAYQFGSPITVSLNSGGTFASPVAYPYRPDNSTGAGNSAYGDIDNDGNGDLIILQSNGSSYQYIVMLKNDGNGAFALYDSIATPSPWIYGMTVADYNNDGRLDIAYPYNGSIYVKYNNGAKSSAGGWTASNTLTAAGVSYLTSADIDNDGDIDLIGMGNSSLNVLKNNGNSTFAAAVAYTGDADKMEARDLNNDQYLDMIYYGGGPKTFRVRLNNGDGTFGSEATTTIGIQPAKMVTGDLDGDGDIDVAFCFQNESYVAAAYNNGSGVFTQQGLFNANLAGLTVMDYDHDGDLDILGKNWNGNVDLNILVNTNPATPSTNASGVSFTNDYGSQFKINWTNGNGTARIVAIKQGSAVTGTPVDNASYSSNAAYGSGSTLSDGSYIVYNGASAGSGSVTVTGLTVNTTYHVAVFEYNGLAGMEKYKTADPGTGSDLTNAVAGFPFATTAGYALRYTQSSNKWDYANDNFTLGSAFTIEAWVKPSAVGSTVGILTFGTNGTGGVMEIGLDASGHFTGLIYDEDAESDITVTGTATATASQWYHLVLSGAAGAPLKLYVNGNLDATSGGNIGTVTTTSGSFYLGGDWNNSNFRGEIDEVRRWSDVRTLDEIRANMHKTLSGIPENLVNYWQFTEGQSDPSDDIVGNNPIYPDGGSLDWVASTAPVGGATIVSASGVLTGSTTIGNATLNMTNGFDNPVDVYVSEVTSEPNSYPTGFSSSIGGKYFVINIFGDPGTFSASVSFTFGPGVVTAEQEANPGLLALYKRESNSTGTWTSVGGAVTAVAATGQVTWSGITSFSQFVALSAANKTPPTITFYKKDYADWNTYQDRISDNVWLARKDEEGLFNTKEETFYDSNGPAGTEWALGKAKNAGSLTFSSLYDAVGGSLGDNILGKELVLHLIAENKYLDVIFHSWTTNGEGGGFSYTRTAMPLEVLNPMVDLTKMTATSATVKGTVYSKDASATAYVLYGTVSGTYTDSLPMTPGTIVMDSVTTVSRQITGLTQGTTYYYCIGASSGSNYKRSGERSFVPQNTNTPEIWSKNTYTKTFTKDDYADWTQPVNQDLLTPLVSITRQDNQGIFNITQQTSYSSSNPVSPAGTEWAVGTTENLEILSFGGWEHALNGAVGDNIVDKDMVMHLIAENVYLDVKFTAWTKNNNGGGFTYTRAVPQLYTGVSGANGVTGTAATLNGKVYSNSATATAYMLLGTSSGAYTDSVAVNEGTISAATWTDVSASKSSLTPGAIYYYCVAATQSDGTYKRGSAGTFVMMSAFADNALAFDGSDDYVTVGNESDFDFTNAVTLEAWIKPSTTAGEHGIVTKNYGTGAHPYQLRVENGEITLGFYDGTWTPITTSGANIPVGEWTHVAGTYDKTTAKIYINGVLSASQNYTANISQNNNPIEIGRTNSSYFSGSIDEVRVWNVARTQQQIQDNMRLPFTSAQSGLVGYWQFNAASGTNAQNHGSSGGNGTLTNFNNTSSSGWVSSDAPIGPFVVGISSTVSGIGNTSATVSGSVFSQSLSATAKFLYGTASGVYTDSVETSPSSIGADAVTSVSASLSSLAPGVLYYVCLAGQNSSYYARSAEITVITYSSTAGNALHFDGNDDYVRIADKNALDLTSTYTLEAWIKPETFSSMAGIISKYHNGGSNGYFIRLSNDAPYTGIRFDEYETASGILTANTWYHIAAVNDNGTRTLYVNGSPVSINGEGYTTNSNSDHVAIGSDFNGRFFDGFIDEVRIWNVARTQQQIQDNMNAPFTSAQSGLVGYWQFNAGAGTVAHGHGSDAGDGTLTNFNFDSNSGWYVSEVPLPVEMAAFTVTAQRLNAELKWKTATEENSYGFEIERSAVATAPKSKSKEKNAGSERLWSKVSFVEGSGTSNAPKDYTFTDKVGKAGKFAYRLKQIDRDGRFAYSQEVEVEVGSVPRVFALEQNYPNPFNPSTMIDFTLEQTGLTTLKIYDIVGREVATLVNNELLEAGVYHQKQFDARNLASGVYFSRLTSGGKVQLKKMMLIK